MVDTPKNEQNDGPFEDNESASEVIQMEELELADEEESLPWLESGEYDDDEPNNDNSRLIGFGLLALLALALLIGLIWWLSNRSPDPELVADGSTIEAPEGDYKERPDDPGGRSFEGSGQTAATVGEGESSEGRLDDGGNADGSGNSGTASGAGAEDGNAPATDGVGVQIAAYSSRDRAVAGWNIFKRQTQALNGVNYRVVEGQADMGRVFRLQAVASNASAANSLCAALKSDGIECQVK